MSTLLQGHIAIKARQVKPGEAYAVEVKAGQFVEITDVAGKQMAVFVAFNAADSAERLSVAATRTGGGSLMLQTGMKLLSNRRNPMFELSEDSVGRHDMLFPPCDERRYKEDFGLDDHPSCRSGLSAALEPFGIDSDQIPDPVNWFMNVAIKQRGELEIREPLSERNDSVVLTALMNSIIGVSACPQDQNDANGGTPTDILVRVYR